MSAITEAGHIRSRDVWEVACGRCRETTDSGHGTRAIAEIVLRGRGWVRTTRHGWVCLACAIDRQQDAPARCRQCGAPTRNPALCIDCANDAEAGDVPY
jgi:hypothetical protein